MIRLVMIALLLSLGASAQTVKGPEDLGNGVERWYRTQRNKPAFFLELEKLYNTVVGGRPAFGKSVAFLVGVSEYQYLPKLPSVILDLDEMRRFLLKSGGFDEVYVVRDNDVDRDLIEYYMITVLPDELEAEDRLLFYYSGHGADYRSLGYMQFAKARPSLFTGKQVLKINDIHDWSATLNHVRHQLFLLDCCASGKAIVARSGGNCADSILDTLSGKGSRTIMTAGSGDQNAYAVDYRYGVFTRAFLDAFRTTREVNSCSLVTTSEIFAFIQKQVATFAKEGNYQLTPRQWVSQRVEHEGTFVFLSAGSERPFTNKESELLNLKKIVLKHPDSTQKNDPPINWSMLYAKRKEAVDEFIEATIIDLVSEHSFFDVSLRDTYTGALLTQFKRNEGKAVLIEKSGKKYVILAFSLKDVNTISVNTTHYEANFSDQWMKKFDFSKSQVLQLIHQFNTSGYWVAKPDVGSIKFRYDFEEQLWVTSKSISYKAD